MKFDDAVFDRTASSFDNPDHVAIVIHNYRWRLHWYRASRNMTIWKSSWPKPGHHHTRHHYGRR
jgi:hypothetical protein